MANPADNPIGGHAAMQARFEADFANGRIGQRHNTFQHRQRVLRQTAEADRVRAAGGQA